MRHRPYLSEGDLALGCHNVESFQDAGASFFPSAAQPRTSVADCHERPNQGERDDEDRAGKGVDGWRGTRVHCTEHGERQRVLPPDSAISSEMSETTVVDLRQAIAGDRVDHVGLHPASSIKRSPNRSTLTRCSRSTSVVAVASSMSTGPSRTVPGGSRSRSYTSARVTPTSSPR